MQIVGAKKKVQTPPQNCFMSLAHSLIAMDKKKVRQKRVEVCTALALARPCFQRFNFELMPEAG